MKREPPMSRFDALQDVKSAHRRFNPVPNIGE